jgi:ubiquinone/menaquinone biosynthesis C-methylase UbiE
MNLTETNIREKEFHDKLQSQEKGRFENIFYKAIYNLSKDFFKYLEKEANNSEILDYGCGVGDAIEKVIKYNPKKITGIDISEVSINKAMEKAKELGINVEYKVDNCEKTKFNNNSFDIIYGSGILHHLKIDQCLNEIHRLLKPNGSLVFIEPLGTNPLINLYRKFTPNSRSKDEHPFTKKDLDYIFNKFVKTKIKYYGFLTLIFFPFYRLPKRSLVFKLLTTLDQCLFKFKFFRLFAWSILITAQKN